MTRQDDLRKFAETWLGRPLHSGDAASIPTSLRIPKALREVYETFGSCRALTRAHDRLLAPETIASRDRFSIFYEENQGVAHWAFRTEDELSDDPIVYKGNSTTKGLVWGSEQLSISEWIRPMTLWQLVNMGYPHGAYAAAIDEATARVSRIYPELAKLGSACFFGCDCQLVCVAGIGSVSSVWTGACDHERHTRMLGQLNFEWEYDSDND
jgi:hypothetical protein